MFVFCWDFLFWGGDFLRGDFFGDFRGNKLRGSKGLVGGSWGVKPFRAANQEV